MTNLYKDIPNCEHPGCDEAGIYCLVGLNPLLPGIDIKPPNIQSKSYCGKHVEMYQKSYELPEHAVEVRKRMLGGS